MRNGNVKWNSLLQPAFLICLAVLAAAAVAVSVVGPEMIRRIPLPPRKPISALDEQALLPYAVVQKITITFDDVLAALGTHRDDYLQWVLEDTEAEALSPFRYCSLFVTYYRTADNVPHVPDECYLGSGNRRQASRESMLQTLVGEADRNNIPVRTVVFESQSSRAWEAPQEFAVLYTFKVNGEYRASRDGTRWVLQNTFGPYSYYAKIEWQFFGISPFDGSSRVYPGREESLGASPRLLDIVLPLLQRDHWPDLRDIEQLDDKKVETALTGQ